MSKPERSTNRELYVFGHYLTKCISNINLVLKVRNCHEQMYSGNKHPGQYFGKVKILKMDLFIILM